MSRCLSQWVEETRCRFMIWNGVMKCNEDIIGWILLFLDILGMLYTVYSWFRSMCLQFTNQSTDFRNFAIVIVRCPCAHDWVWLPMSPGVSSFVFRQEPVLTIDVWHTLHGDSVCWIWDLAFSDIFHQVWHFLQIEFWPVSEATKLSQLMIHAYIPPVVISVFLSLDRHHAPLARLA